MKLVSLGLLTCATLLFYSWNSDNRPLAYLFMIVGFVLLGREVFKRKTTGH
jgi:hypothetical protein